MNEATKQLVDSHHRLSVDEARALVEHAIKMGWMSKRTDGAVTFAPRSNYPKAFKPGRHVKPAILVP